MQIQKSKSAFISASARGPITHECKRIAHIPALGMWRHLAMESEGGGLALPRQPAPPLHPSPPPPPPVRMRVVNLLRLTPGFVPDVYLVCKKCFYLLSKYV